MSDTKPRAAGAQLLMLGLLAAEFVLALVVAIGEYREKVADPRAHAAFINGPAVGVIVGYGVALLVIIVAFVGIIVLWRGMSVEARWIGSIIALVAPVIIGAIGAVIAIGLLILGVCYLGYKTTESDDAKSDGDG